MMSTTIREIRQPGERYNYTYSGAHTPIAEVGPGEKVVIYALDAFANRITQPDHKVSERCPQPYNVDPLTGPVIINGAEPGDSLRVHIHDIQPDREFAVTSLIANFGGLTRTNKMPLLHDPLPERSRIMPIRDGFVHFDEQIKVPYSPFLGCIGVAPFLEAIISLTPDYFGGNMDCHYTCPGNTIIFPVSHAGAHFFCGDAHACQGDGELSGVAAEMPSRTTLSFSLDKGKTIRWPRVESPTHIGCIGAGRPMDDAARIAYFELIEWMAADYGFEKLEAYELLAQVGELRLGNMVDPNYTFCARIDRKYLKKK
jgi:amidase